MIEINVDPGDENYIPDIQSWLDRVSPEHTSDLKTIYLLGDKAMTNVVTNFLPSHPRPQNINGIVSGGSVLLRKRENDECGGIEGSFYHEIGHLVFLKKDRFERRMHRGDLFDIWQNFVGRFAYFYDAAYANDESEIYARVYSYYMLVTNGKVSPIVDLPEIVSWVMETMQKMFSN